MNRKSLIAVVMWAVIAGTCGAQTAESVAPAGQASGSEVAESIEDRPILGERTGAAAKPLETGRRLDDTLNVIGSLAVVIGLVAAVVWILRRFAPRAVRMYASDNLKVLSRTYVGPKQMVCLVKAPGRVLVLGATQQSVTLLSEITDPAEVERIAGLHETDSSKGATAAFREMVAGISGSRRKHKATEEGMVAAVNSVSDRFANLARKVEDLR